MEIASSATGTWQAYYLLSIWYRMFSREVELELDTRKGERENQPSRLSGHHLARCMLSGRSFLKSERTRMTLVMRVVREVE